MQTQPYLKYFSRATMMVVCALSLAQTATSTRAQANVSPTLPKPTEETLVLSPFEVNATADTGYMASSTLAGSRLNSSLLTTPPHLPRRENRR